LVQKYRPSSSVDTAVHQDAEARFCQEGILALLGREGFAHEGSPSTLVNGLENFVFELFISKLNHYSNLEQPPETGHIRAGAHTDYGMMTILIGEN